LDSEHNSYIRFRSCESRREQKKTGAGAGDRSRVNLQFIVICSCKLLLLLLLLKASFAYLNAGAVKSVVSNYPPI